LKKMKSDLDEKEGEITRLKSEITTLQAAESQREAENTSLMSKIKGLQTELAAAKEFNDRQNENLVAARAQLLQLQQIQQQFPIMQQNGPVRQHGSERDRSRSRSRRYRRRSRSYSRSPSR